MTPTLSVAFCTYNRASQLPGLVDALRRQQCPVPFEILAVDNNSSDETPHLLQDLARRDGAPLRYVREARQGIPFARNRAIAESLRAGTEFLLFIDDDELPAPGLLSAAADALGREGAECVGGRIRVVLPDGRRPRWLTEDMMGFLGALDHGDGALWVRDLDTPLWSGNIGYRTAIFAEDENLRFDVRYNRRGAGVGGGSDAIMFRELVGRGAAIRYRPDMEVCHYVELDKISRSYFLRLHFAAGRKFGEYRSPEYERAFLGVPPFLIRQAAGHWLRVLAMAVRRDVNTVRQAMNGSYALGTILGLHRRYRRYPSRGAERGSS
ncbi:glycosyltransferase [Spiribacter halobius]|uniref:Glycosyltransferase n=1 Tax=Sediminicurvatus halobius TaxID=2182432 RepID=A0A2U2MXL9_9GAMM|nr:glycosyltransferase [Spiribacter halobius]PWG61705.1 glycosyltransferase [Spiribacter halobius]UEX77328.1 glycosyltransferase [Spiribacter halobius]